MNMPANGGVGRRIVEDRGRTPSRSQVPVVVDKGMLSGLKGLRKVKKIPTAKPAPIVRKPYVEPPRTREQLVSDKWAAAGAKSSENSRRNREMYENMNEHREAAARFTPRHVPHTRRGQLGERHGGDFSVGQGFGKSASRATRDRQSSMVGGGFLGALPGAAATGAVVRHANSVGGIPRGRVLGGLAALTAGGSIAGAKGGKMLAERRAKAGYTSKDHTPGWMKGQAKSDAGEIRRSESLRRYHDKHPSRDMSHPNYSASKDSELQELNHLEKDHVGKADRSGKTRFAATMGGGVLLGGATGAAAGHALRKPIGRLALARAARKATVIKAQRYYDPEHRRQRRMGLSEAALLGAGGALAFRGGRGIKRSSSAVREALRAENKTLLHPQTKGRDAATNSALAYRKRDVAQLAAGGGAGVGAGVINYQGNHERGKHWR